MGSGEGGNGRYFKTLMIWFHVDYFEKEGLYECERKGNVRVGSALLGFSRA